MKPYPPAWSIIPQAFIRKERLLGDYKVGGTPLVSPGQDVVPDQPILRWSNADKSFTGQSSRAFAARMPHPLFSSSQEIVPAGLRGRVIEITDRGGVLIESHATLVQGVIGAGSQVVGILTLWHPNSPNNRQTIPPGAILVVPDPINFMFLRQCVASGVVGIVSSSISLRDLEGFLHVDLIAFLQEERPEQRMLLQQHFPRLTLLLTQGLALDHRSSNPSLPSDSYRRSSDPSISYPPADRRGSDPSLPISNSPADRRGSDPSLPIFTSPNRRRGSGSSLPSMPTDLVDTLKQHEGSIALLSGETSFRNNTVPELIISLPSNASPLTSPPVQPDTLLIPGAQVRVCSSEQQGITGTIDYLFTYEQNFPSGVSARAARLRLEDGSFLVVPLLSLERIG